MSTPVLDGGGWWVYVLRCRDGTLYTGAARDVAHRVAAHTAGRGARYTRGRGPLTVVYTEAHPGRSEALRREFEIKRLSARAKRALVGATAQAPPPGDCDYGGG